jgi:hypothetical protein
MGTERRLPIEWVSKRLAPLEQSGRVMTYVMEHRQEIESLIFDGFNELIDRFNRLDEEELERLALLMERTSGLKTILGGIPLPKLEEISSKEVVGGIKKARILMTWGQCLEAAMIPDAPGIRRKAIFTPTMATSEKALAIGTTGHLIERAMFSHFERRGVSHRWQKDDVLHALEEVAMLMEAEFRDGVGSKPSLLEIFTAPPSLDEKGGLGWRRPEEVEEFIGKYCLLYP